MDSQTNQGPSSSPAATRHLRTTSTHATALKVMSLLFSKDLLIGKLINRKQSISVPPKPNYSRCLLQGKRRYGGLEFSMLLILISATKHSFDAMISRIFAHLFPITPGLSWIRDLFSGLDIRENCKHHVRLSVYFMHLWRFIVPICVRRGAMASAQISCIFRPSVSSMESWILSGRSDIANDFLLCCNLFFFVAGSSIFALLFLVAPPIPDIRSMFRLI